jgi:large subunit ribosomal protein L40
MTSQCDDQQETRARRRDAFATISCFLSCCLATTTTTTTWSSPLALETPSMSLLSASRQARSSIQHPLRLAQTSVRHAGRKVEGSDPKREILRRVLYPGNVRLRGASPTGAWRPDVGRALQRAIPSVQAHETIERAWLLHQRHVRKARDAELARKFERMREAMDTLLELDPELYKAANRMDDPRVRTQQEQQLTKTLKGSERRAMEGRIRGLFPRDLRPPTDTPPRDGWKYDWTPVKRSANNTTV